MRILLATDAFPPNCGGSGWSTWELARGLRARGHAITLVQPRPGTPDGPRLREYDGFIVHEFGLTAPNVPYLRNYIKNERLTRQLRTWMEPLAREQRIELLHAQHVLTAPATVHLGRDLRVPTVVTVRDYWPVCYWSDLIIDPADRHLCPRCSVTNMTRCVRPRAGAAWPLALPLIPYMRANLLRKRTALASADAIVAVSSTIADDLRSRAPEIATTRLETIPNPVSLDSLREAAAAPAPLGGAFAVYVGKLAPNKGAGWLVDVARRAGLRMPLVIVGDGPDRTRLEADARAAGLDVRFVGWQARDQALTWLAHATLVVFPSHGPESLSRVLLEAGALGRAIAAMNTGGTRDIIQHDVTGLLSSSPEGLADDVARLAADAGLRSRLGAAARAHVEATFEASRVVARVEALYAEVVRGGSRG